MAKKKIFEVFFIFIFLFNFEIFVIFNTTPLPVIYFQLIIPK